MCLYISDTIRYDFISISHLFDIGINVAFTPSGVTGADGVVSVCGRHKGRLYKLSSHDFLSLSSGRVLNICGQKRNLDNLDLWHRLWLIRIVL